MSTSFDSFTGVIFSEITSSPSDDAVIYSIIVSHFGTKVLRRINVERLRLEHLFCKAVQVAVFLRSDLTQVQTLQTKPVVVRQGDRGDIELTLNNVGRDIARRAGVEYNEVVCKTPDALANLLNSSNH